MIQVTKHGEKLSCKCPNCGAEMTYERSDVHTHTESHKGNWDRIETYTEKYIMCPDCGERIDVYC